MQIILRIPGYSDVVFDSYEDLNIIWEVLENYKNCSLTVKYNNEENTEVNESVDIITETTAKLSYTVPKSITFTQRFLDRVSKDIIDILNTVYPDMFSIVSINFQDIEDDEENMKIIIEIGANNEDALNSLKYLDKNVEYIMKDLIDYYT